jgi:hypothetical protein
MSKIGLTILGILLIVGAVFVFSNNAPKSTVNDVKPVVSASEASFASPDVSTPDVTPEGPADTPEPVLTSVNTLSFKDVIYDSFSGGFALRGQIYATPEGDVKDVTIKLYCNGVYQAEALSLTDGTFEVKGPCVSGNEAYVTASYDGNTYESKHMMLTKGFRRHSSSVSGTVGAVVAVDSSVPEFSTMTLGVAIVLTTIGLIYLRKNE